MMDKTILDLSRQKIEYADLGRQPRGRPRRAAVRLLHRRRRGRARRPAGPARRRCGRRHGHGYHTLRAVTPAQQAALLKVRKSSLGLLMAAVGGHEAGRWRSSRTPRSTPSTSPTTPRRFAEVLDRHGLTAGFYGHASVGCLHIRPFVDLTEPGAGGRDASGRRARSRTWSRSTAASTPASTATAWPAASSTARSSATTSTRRCARSRRLFDPDDVHEPRQDRRRAVDDRQPARRRAAAAPAPLRTRLDVRRRRRDARRRRPLHEHRRCAARARPVSMCPSYIATREGGALHPRPRQRAGEGAHRARPARPRWATSGCTRSSTSA